MSFVSILFSKEFVSAVVGAAIGILGARWIQWLQSRQERRKNIADFLDGIAKDLEIMSTSFKAGQIPHAAGHALEGKITILRNRLLKYLDPKFGDRFAKLEELAYNAGNLDEHLYKLASIHDLKSDKKEDFQQWIRVAQGLSGDLRAFAANIKTL